MALFPPAHNEIDSAANSFSSPLPVGPQNISLIGFMGSGKTTVGRALAARMGWPFVDTDARIVEAAGGRTIPTLFAEEGEAAFRAREAEVVRAVCAESRRIVATGGGVPVHPGNAAVLRSAGLVVWLTARPDVVVERTRRTAHARPVLAGLMGENAGSEAALRARILGLIAERAPCYQCAADLIVDSSDRAPDAIAAEIQRRAQRLWETRGAA